MTNGIGDRRSTRRGATSALGRAVDNLLDISLLMLSTYGKGGGRKQIFTIRRQEFFLQDIGASIRAVLVLSDDCDLKCYPGHFKSLTGSVGQYYVVEGILCD